MHNVMKWMQNEFSVFCDFCFWDILDFVLNISSELGNGDLDNGVFDCSRTWFWNANHWYVTDNQLARGIQSKGNWCLGKEPQVGCAGAPATHKPVGLEGGVLLT